MPKKIQDCTMAHLIGVSLPQHAATYTVISHQFVIDYSKQQLAAAGFVIVDEEYRCTADGQIAQGIYKLNFNSDPELSMMFAWTNSYNKQVKFKCLIGAYINRTGTVMTSGELGTWSRKHTGTADTETKDMIDTQVQNANMYYDQLVADKTSMEGISLNKRRQAQMLGILFAEFQILTTEQSSMVRNQMDRPSHVFADSNSLWAFYNYVTIALQHSHPRTWMEDQRILHYFISTVGNFQPVSAPVPALSTPPQDLSAPVEEVDPLYVIPNQTNILDQIAEIETENDDTYDDTYDDTSDENDDTSIEVPDNQVVQEDPEMLEIVHQVEEILESLDEAEETPFDLDAEDDAILDIVLKPISPIEFKAENPTLETGDHVKYTDPAGNTFEAPIVPPCAGHDAETEKELISDFSLPEEDEDLSQRAADLEMMEAVEQSEGTEVVADLDNVPVEKKEEIIDDSFDLDFTSSDTEESGDNIPDFF
jgi:hypothetical protein